MCYEAACLGKIARMMRVGRGAAVNSGAERLRNAERTKV